MKRRNGITVIVLVITIIIMLILAGIALNMVIDDKGLIEKSNKSNFDLALSEMYERGNPVYVKSNNNVLHIWNPVQ